MLLLIFLIFLKLLKLLKLQSLTIKLFFILIFYLTPILTLEHKHSCVHYCFYQNTPLESPVQNLGIY